jgi:succinyl-CoA synthetase alpha subunit
MSATIDRVRRGFYMDSAALMRLAGSIAARPGVEQAALMIGSISNKRLLEEAGLLGDAAKTAGPNDLVIAVRAVSAEAASAAIAEAERLLDQPRTDAARSGEYRPRSLAAAAAMLPDANLALISVPGEFAADEAMKALRRNLHVMLFSDNVAVEAEVELKTEAARRGLLMMGPDCGSAIIAGAPIGFANVVPRGDIGIVSASGTGLQEVSCLLARAGSGISHAIGVGGRDLGAAVGGMTTLAAIAALDEDAATRTIIVISKPPEPAVARRVIARMAESRKRFILCFLGTGDLALPANARAAATLREAAALAGVEPAPIGPALAAAVREAAIRLGPERRWLRGLFTGGTLCAEAQVVLQTAGAPCASNAPIPGAAALGLMSEAAHTLVDLGADAYTVGRPHPMIEPEVRTPHLAAALADPTAAIVLLDLVLGYGSHPDPADAVAGAMRRAPADRPIVIASVTGTAEDPQGLAAQTAPLLQAGIILAPSNAAAAELALAAIRARS